MPSTNHIKIGGSAKLSLSKGNITVGVSGTTEYGPTSQSGFYNGITPPVGGYTLYVEKGSQGPSIHVASDNTQCMFFLKSFGAPDGTIDDMLTWSLTQNTILVLKSELINSIQNPPFQNVAGTNDATGFFFGGFRNDGLLDLVKVGWLANGTGVTNAPVTAIDRTNQTITISGSQFVSGQFYTFSLNTSAPTTYTIGQSALGGIIAYINGGGSTGTSGLVATASDISTGTTWGCVGTALSGADGTAIGTGNQNTIDIMAGCATAGIAARLCGDLTEGGYSDWYLPSKDELNALYTNKASIGGFANYAYWSSTEYSTASAAYYQDFTNGYADGAPKNSADIYVRAVRSF